MDIKKCVGCGCDIKVDEDKCPFCGIEQMILNTSDMKLSNSSIVNTKLQNRAIAYVLLIAGVILCIISFTRINTREYKHAQQFYTEWTDAYNESKDLADSNIGFFKRAYNSLADENLEHANEQKAIMNKYRIQLGVLLVLGVGAIAVGIVLIRKRD